MSYISKINLVLNLDGFYTQEKNTMLCRLHFSACLLPADSPENPETAS